MNSREAGGLIICLIDSPRFTLILVKSHLRRTVTSALFGGMRMNAGEMFDQQNVPGFGHSLSGRGPDAILVITPGTPGRGPGTLPPRLRPHFRQILLLEVSQGHVLDHVLADDRFGTDETNASLSVKMVEELEPLVKERLEVDVLPLQGLDAGVVVVTAV